MKTKQIAFLAAAAFLLSSGVAYAHEDDPLLGIQANAQVNSTGTVEIGNEDRENVELRSEVRARIEARKAEAEDRRVEMQERRSEIEVRLSERVQARIENFANGLFRALDAGVDRLENIAERIGSRIEKLEDQGLDMDAQAELLAGAELEIDESEAEIAEAHLALEAMLSSDTPREALEDVKLALSEAKQSLREAKQALMETLQSIKQSLKGQNGEASAEVEAEVEVENQ